MKKEIKSFVKTNKKTIMFVGKVILGVAVTVVLLGLSKEIMNRNTTHLDIYQEQPPEQPPTYSDEWKSHCNDNNLLYDSGLPIFVDDSQTIVYRDAIDDQAVEDWLDMGGKIVDRV